ncbi:XRE family transcriptional regulator [Candidatus Woesearchaeota archaeon CG10_big_fil_rev_8_21_14_0_10_36_11]|nr:MAG: XRE family transcriptional regulator [Candidatus Woesearchaeota archaeon CG10_big_fil_rev_8_21_14_0_10_36_11]
MIQELDKIKRMRKKHNLNQKELAKKAGVSQSLIAKIEAGTIEPSFSKAQQIFHALEEMREKKERKANELMNKIVVFVKNNDTVKESVKIMKKKGISQMPVLCKGKVCGLITEGTIIKGITNNPEKINIIKVNDIMEDAPPIISVNTGIKTVLELLKDNPVLLVAEKGEIQGIISKSDLLEKIE